MAEVDVDQLILKTKALAEKLVHSVDGHKNLATVKGHEELIRKLKDLLSDFEEHEERLRSTIRTSSYVHRNLSSLETTMKDVDKFVDELASARMLFFSKTKMKNKLLNILHSLRAKNTQLMTSVTLELLSRAKKTGETVHVTLAPTRPANTVEFDLGYAYFHGICRPRNFILAVEHFREAAKEGDPEAMLMLAECYTGEFGLEKDEHLSSEWIEKATLLNCPGAMHKKAKKILKVLDCTNQDNIHKILSFFESPQGANEIDLNDSTYTPGSEIDQIASPLSTFRSNNRKYRNKKKGRSQSPMKESLSGGEDLGSTSKGEEQEEGKRSGEFDNIKEKLPDNSPGMSNTTMNDTKSDKEGRENGEMDDYNNNDYYDSDYSNLELAVQLLLKSAELNFVAAKTDLGILFELAADDQRAVEWFTLASSGGCPKATNRLGLLYFHGKGVTLDLERAFSLFVSAAKSGDKDANNNAGTCLEQGIGTELRPSAALFYYTKGAEQDSAQAMYSLGYLLIKSSVKSLEDLVIAKGVQSIHGQQQRIGNISLLKEKFSAPSTVGKIPLGLGSHRGPDGSAIKKDPTGGVGTVVGVGNKTSWQSNQYSSKSQKASVSQIGNNLSLSLPLDAKSYKPNFDTRNKKGLDLGSEFVTDSYTDPWLAQEIKAEEQVKEGIRWLRSAAERGILDARYQLGLVYEKGIGCPSDLPSALAQYEYAAKDGHAKAAMAAGNILYDNLIMEKPLLFHADSYDSVVDIRYRRVMNLYRVAASQGHPDAMNCLAILLEDGRGCVRGKPEIQEAASWYMEACIGGVRNAAVNLALLLRKGSIQSLQSLDGTEQFSLSDISIWLEKCVKKMNMSVSSRQEIDILIAQLVGDNVRIENRYRLEFETTGGQLQSFNNSRNSSSRHPNYSGNNTLEDEDTDRYRGREEERGYSDDRRLKDTEIEREREWAWEMEKERERERQFGPRIMH